MKNILIVLMTLFCVSIAAQETDSVLRSKKGIPILPQAGDWAIGADAAPYLEYFGNSFNNSTKNKLDLGSQTLYLRHFLTNNTAVRLLVGIDKKNSVDRYFIQDDAAYFANNLSNTKTQDKITTNNTDLRFDLGYQIFRGYGRLRGFYGAHLIYNYSRTKNKSEYGNPMSATNPTPSSYSGAYNGSNRTLESDGGIYHSVGVGAIAGVEYYFAPKICVGGEISLDIYNTWKTEGNTQSEYWNGSNAVKIDNEVSPAGRTSTGVITDRPANYGGSLYLMFHF
jgi:hypothetical protein